MIGKTTIEGRNTDENGAKTVLVNTMFFLGLSQDDLQKLYSRSSPWEKSQCPQVGPTLGQARENEVLGKANNLHECTCVVSRF